MTYQIDPWVHVPIATTCKFIHFWQPMVSAIIICDRSKYRHLYNYKCPNIHWHFAIPGNLIFFECLLSCAYFEYTFTDHIFFKSCQTTGVTTTSAYTVGFGGPVFHIRLIMASPRTRKSFKVWWNLTHRMNALIQRTYSIFKYWEGSFKGFCREKTPNGMPRFYSCSNETCQFMLAWETRLLINFVLFLF